MFKTKLCKPSYHKVTSITKLGLSMLKTVFKELNISTSSQFELVDLTKSVESIVSESDIVNGICLVYAPHATAAVVVNEREAGLMKDILTKLNQEYPKGAGWLHDRIDDNAHAHLASAFIGSFKIFPILNRRLYRGTWQSIFLVEMDGPRGRKVLVEILGS